MQSHLPPHVAKDHADPTVIFGKGFSCSEPPPWQVDIVWHQLTAEASCLVTQHSQGLVMLRLCREHTAAREVNSEASHEPEEHRLT